jgi:putative endonuclease
MADKDELGRVGEERAASFLRAQGYAVLDRNWRCAIGEIDLVVRRGGRLIVVEVKTRRTDLFGHPFEAVGTAKRRRLWRLVHAWIRDHPEAAAGCEPQVDVIGVVGDDPSRGVIEHLEDLR